MKSIKIDISNNIAKVIEKPKRIVAGTIGLPVEFTFDSVWDGLIKTAVFTTGGKVYQMDEIDSTTTVPWEVLSVPGPQLMIGVYGEDKEGTLAIPTIWAYVDPIRPGANLIDSTANPSPAPIWVKLKKEVDAGCIADININDEGEMEITFLNGETINLGKVVGKDGAPGKDGVDGKDGAPGKDGVDGKDGAPGKDGVDGKDGAPGKNGVSPTVTVTNINGGHRVSITDANVTQSFDVMDGASGTNLAACSYATGVLPKGRAKGDVNGDGIINIDDRDAIQAHSSGTTVITDSIALWAAECDGYVNAFAVVQYINKQYDRYSPYAADYYGNWQFDSANGHYYYDIAANGMTADCGCIIVPNVTFKGFKQAIPMSGAIRMCFKGCPTEEILCRILYNTELEGVTVENGVANSFLDGGGSGGVGIKAITIEEVGTVLISFTIDGWGTYQAKEGMTWAEWIESEYNTIGAEADGKDVIFPDDPDWNSTWYVLDEDGNSVTPDDVIAADYTYLVE